MLQSGVVDVQGNIADYVDHCKKTDIPLPLDPADNDDKQAAASYSSKQLGDYIYRKYVSDHLPVYVDLVVTENPATKPAPPSPLAPLPTSVRAFGAWVVSDIDDFEILPAVQVT